MQLTFRFVHKWLAGNKRQWWKSRDICVYNMGVIRQVVCSSFVATPYYIEKVHPDGHIWHPIWSYRQGKASFFHPQQKKKKALEKIHYTWRKQDQGAFSGVWMGLMQAEASSYAYMQRCATFFKTNKPTRGRALPGYSTTSIWLFASHLTLRSLQLPGEHLVNHPYS